MNGQLARSDQGNTQVALDHQHNVAQQVRQATALESIAQRLQISQKQLVATLKATVFSACRNDDEFAALIVVSNEYQLNPLLKEIYAFPQKGGGIVPMVSIDGWLKLMNAHPQFDGIEYSYIPDGGGKLMAIEATIWRKDRSRPIKVTEYLEECKRETDPWRKSPSRMLRHRATIQCARVAFGFSGIGDAEEDVTVYLGGDIEPQDMRRANIMPSNDQLLEQRREAQASTGETIDADTGEIIDEEQIARQLDAQTMHGESQGDSDAAEEEQEPAWVAKFREIQTAILEAKTLKQVKAAKDEFIRHCVTFDDDKAAALETQIAEAMQSLTKPANA